MPSGLHREYSLIFVFIGIVFFKGFLTGCGGGSMTPQPSEDGPSTAPVILSFSPTSGFINTPVTIEGKHFGATASENKVLFAGIEAETVEVLEEGKIVATVPEGMPEGLVPLSVTVKGRKSNEVLFHIIASRSYPAGDAPVSVAVEDLNGDGILDLAVANQNIGGLPDSRDTVSVLLGNGKGAFRKAAEYPPGGLPWAVAVSDLDDNASPDMIVTSHFNNNLSVLLGQGDGTFQKAVGYSVGEAPKAAAVGDLNGDGRPDIVVANSAEPSLSVLLGNGDGTLQPAADIDVRSRFQRFFQIWATPQSVELHDLNGDRVLAVAIATQGGSPHYLGQGVSVLLGNGDGTFLDARHFSAGESPSAIAVGDLDNNGIPDLTVANQGGNNISILLGQGGGIFRTAGHIATGVNPLSVVIEDLDQDDSPDIVVTNAGDLSGHGTISILLGNGDGTFLAPRPFTTGAFPLSTAVKDLNRDGSLDLAIANGLSRTVTVLLGNGDGTFLDAPEYAAGYKPLSLATGDLDGNGSLDLATANASLSDNVSVLLGQGDGTFQEAVHFDAGPRKPNSLMMEDLDNDHIPDLIIAAVTDESHTDYQGNLSILKGNGDGTFLEAVDLFTVDRPGYLRIKGIEDLNGDSCLDLIMINSGSLLIMAGNGNGSFQEAVEYATEGKPTSVAIGDLNGDTHHDLAVTTFKGSHPDYHGNLLVFTGMETALSAMQGALALASGLLL